MKEGWWERKRESKCVHRKKAKRQQKSNSLTSVWDAVVASEGQRGEINTSWFAEGGRVGGGEKRRAREMRKKTDSTDQKIQIPHKKEKSGINETKCSYMWFYTRAPVVHWQVRLVFLGLAGGWARGGGVLPVGESRLGESSPWTLWGSRRELSCMAMPRERLGGRPGRELHRKYRQQGFNDIRYICI